ncbi:hypothetical protein QBC40DRAFT_41810 [Triangularia verruculosa]|uniref:Uncharacterized protein n=1 Tax=Triangularia verruculosa TaxID=2587418 RepID=A0AAN6X4V5_9PEZI|nr:hypothetical protein QBC40DRAFT_41810 [Triangularia verruculosa]
MATMATKLPSDAFWPSGAVDADARLSFPTLSSDSSSTIISPLTLPRGAAGYFDQRIIGGNPKAQVYSPLSPGVRGPGLQQQSFLSPHILHDQYRSSSLPPQARQNITSPAGQENNSRSSQDSTGTVHGLTCNGLNGHPRSLSDSSSQPSQASMIRRLITQNGRIREAWEAERKYMEANRERAEEVYKEERALMEEERAEWETEKTLLLKEIERLQSQLLGGANSTLSPRNGNIMSQQGSFSSTTGLRGGAAWEASPESMKSSHSSHSNGSGGQKNLAVYQQASLAGSPGPALKHSSLPQLRTASNVLEPLPERISIGHIPSSGLSPISATASETDGTPVPILDVQEIIPELEGIPLKAPAVQKPTFTDGPSMEDSNGSSRSSSPQNSSDEAKAPRASKVQTLQVLAAHESARLTMHAGHTPSHSLSLLTTVVSSGAATATSSGDSTPTVQQGDGPVGRVEAVVQMQQQQTFEMSQQASDAESVDDHPEQVYEPSEGDARLKGPLMVRNMPAHDEIFFRRLSDKLEEVAQDREASLPAVLKDADSPEEAKAQAEVPASEASSTTEKDNGSPKSGDGDDQDFDIPLKIKKSNNFGAPFGSSRW